MKTIIVNGVVCTINNEACYNCIYCKVGRRYDDVDEVDKPDYRCKLDGIDDSKGICPTWSADVGTWNQLNKLI